jgi:DNA-binding LacI/PurR family transcriptional regulator
VLEAIARLGYRRNSAARALVTRRSATIGVISPASPLFGPASTVISVEWAAREAGYFVSLASVRMSDREGLRHGLEHFMDQAVEGIVVIAPRDLAAELIKDAAGQVPTIVVADCPRLPNIHSVSVDQAAGARLAVSHLVELGHRTVLHLSGPHDWFDARARTAGWRSAMRKAGLSPDRLVHGDWTAESGYAAGVALVASGLPDAIFAANDEMALGLLRAFRQHGIAVPGEVSVVGFDDIAGSAFYDPPLTTVRQDFTALGLLAMRNLQRWLGGARPGISSRHTIKPTLIVRSSSAARPASRRGRRFNRG